MRELWVTSLASRIYKRRRQNLTIYSITCVTNTEECLVQATAPMWAHPLCKHTGPEGLSIYTVYIAISLGMMYNVLCIHFLQPCIERRGGKCLQCLILVTQLQSNLRLTSSPATVLMLQQQLQPAPMQCSNYHNLSWWSLPMVCIMNIFKK